MSWLICGSEYLLLGGDSFVCDVIKVPPHSKTAPFFMGSCELNGKESKDTFVAILDNEKATDASTLPAKVAWKIDEKKQFVSVPVEGLRYLRTTGVSTEDSDR